jgi:hypothetical protein
MPRFVILEHDHPRLHWDLMLEHGDVLRTWRLAESPRADGADVPAEPSFDHRPLYLDYEGPVSGDRGTVRRWDHGTYTVVEDNGDSLTIQFVGERLRGLLVLRRTGEGAWVFGRLQEG